MFDWLKKPKASPMSATTLPLYFKDPLAAFEYGCKSLQSDISGGALLQALVLDSAVATGSGVAVKRQPDGNQIAMPRVCSKDGGYIVIASSASANGPSLQPGDLVAWQVGAPIEVLASQFSDPRSTWCGLILAKQLPEDKIGRGCVIQQPFKP